MEVHLCIISIEKEYKYVPAVEHCITVAEVLGKFGHINEAVEFIEALPFEPTTKIRTLMLMLITVVHVQRSMCMWAYDRETVGRA